MNDATPKERNVAMVFQNYALYPHMSVRENIGLNLKIAGRPRTEIAERVETAARLLDIAPLLDRRPAQLSGGQRQRVAMGRAIVRDPEVFLFDEPLSNLDAKLRVQMRAEIKGLQAKVRKTSIYVTHDQVEAMTLADRVVVMNGGRIEQQGTPMELYLRPANRFVAGFIGSPGMNFIPVRIEAGDAVTMAGGRLTVSAPSQTREAVAGVRPEDLSLAGPDAPLKGQVTLIEPMGAQTHLAVFHGDSTLWVTVAGMPPVNVGEEVGLIVSACRVDLFEV
jgi:multiple sugar transport system ATP-binding protein